MLRECMMVDWLQITAIIHFRGNPVLVIPGTAVLPQRSSPIQRYYREFHFRYRGFPAVTAVLPLSPLPCSSLISNNNFHAVARLAKLTVSNAEYISYFPNCKAEFSLHLNGAAYSDASQMAHFVWTPIIHFESKKLSHFCFYCNFANFGRF